MNMLLTLYGYKTRAIVHSWRYWESTYINKKLKAPKVVTINGCEQKRWHSSEHIYAQGRITSRICHVKLYTMYDLAEDKHTDLDYLCHSYAAVSL